MINCAWSSLHLWRCVSLATIIFFQKWYWTGFCVCSRDSKCFTPSQTSSLSRLIYLLFLVAPRRILHLQGDVKKERLTWLTRVIKTWSNFRSNGINWPKMYKIGVKSDPKTCFKDWNWTKIDLKQYDENSPNLTPCNFRKKALMKCTLGIISPCPFPWSLIATKWQKSSHGSNEIPNECSSATQFPFSLSAAQ